MPRNCPRKPNSEPEHSGGDGEVDEQSGCIAEGRDEWRGENSGIDTDRFRDERHDPTGRGSESTDDNNGEADDDPDPQVVGESGHDQACQPQGQAQQQAGAQFLPGNGQQVLGGSIPHCQRPGDGHFSL